MHGQKSIKLSIVKTAVHWGVTSCSVMCGYPVKPSKSVTSSNVSVQ